MNHNYAKKKCRNMTNFTSKPCSIPHNCIPDVNIFKQKMWNSSTILHTLDTTKNAETMKNIDLE